MSGAVNYFGSGAKTDYLSKTDMHIHVRVDSIPNTYLHVGSWMGCECSWQYLSRLPLLVVSGCEAKPWLKSHGCFNGANQLVAPPLPRRGGRSPDLPFPTHHLRIKPLVSLCDSPPARFHSTSQKPEDHVPKWRRCIQSVVARAPAASDKAVHLRDLVAHPPAPPSVVSRNQRHRTRFAHSDRAVGISTLAGQALV